MHLRNGQVRGAEIDDEVRCVRVSKDIKILDVLLVDLNK